MRTLRGELLHACGFLVSVSARHTDDIGNEAVKRRFATGTVVSAIVLLVSCAVAPLAADVYVGAAGNRDEISLCRAWHPPRFTIGLVV